MRVLVLGSGGREHALCWGLSRSPQLRKLFILPGNAGTARLGANIAGDPADAKLVVEVARREQIDLVVVGPEDPLAVGVVDALRRQGVRVFGPTAAAAKLEADKAYAKQFMRQHAIPTAEARIFDDYQLAREFIATRDEALVVKAAGLAKGKGVIVCDEPSDAILAAENMLMKRVFGAAGDSIVVEEKLAGVETSLLCLVDGHTLYVLDPAQDYKRLRDGDQGPNTGGMGCVCPTNTITPEVMRQIETQILVPTMDALVREEVDYRGLLYVGLMLTLAGPKVLEFNCRFGDPETQVIIPRMRADLIDVLGSVADGRLETVQIDWDPRQAVCVVAASEGYPDQAATGRLVRGLADLGERDDVMVFQAGTKLQAGDVVTSGGRVLGVTGLAATRAEAAQKAYGVLEKIKFEGMQYRKDIGAGGGRIRRT